MSVAISTPTSWCPILHSSALAASKAELGKDAVILGHHCPRDEVVKSAELKDRKVNLLDPSVCVCTTMFRITLQHLLWALENLGEGKVANRISVDEQTRHYAKAALDRMLSLHER